MRRLPLHGWVGLGLVGVSWYLNWTLPGLRTHLLFLPLWLGYVLVVDALVLVRAGTSILSRSRPGFIALFLASVPVWWLFELLNQRLRNWHYLGGEELTDLQYALLASLSFSTVIPAVFETAELLRTFRWTERFGRGPRVPDTDAWRRAYLAAGASLLALLLAWPLTFYPLCWISLIFVLEPVARWLGRRSLLAHLSHGDWRPVVALALGALVCGVFWELWNWRAYPKWVYTTPGWGFWYVFEMPLFGYFGYLPFGLELYPMAQLLLPRPPEVRV
jgi:hypothetical protein